RFGQEGRAFGQLVDDDGVHGPADQEKNQERGQRAGGKEQGHELVAQLHRITVTSSPSAAGSGDNPAFRADSRLTVRRASAGKTTFGSSAPVRASFASSAASRPR